MSNRLTWSVTHFWVVFPVLETSNLVCVWRVEVSIDPPEILVELPEVEYTLLAGE